MLETKIISSKELSKFGSSENLNKKVLALLKQQKAKWEIAEKNFEALNLAQTRDIIFEHLKITAQFNPGRIRSSAAKTDAKSLAERPCFLCLQNLPDDQKGILFREKYILLINPFPIFSEHLVIAELEHVPQQIFSYFSDMLDLSKKLPDFTVFYNGPKCGASAPDHFHFQAIGKGNLPVEKEFEMLEKEYAEILIQDKNLKILAVENYLWKFIAIISSNKQTMNSAFEQFYHLFDLKDGDEPMINVLCSFTGNEWRVIVFPRRKQRPSCFFREGDDRIVVGAASVEMGGVVVLPREEDFKKITLEDIAEIYEDVLIKPEEFDSLKNKLRQQTKFQK